MLAVPKIKTGSPDVQETGYFVCKLTFIGGQRDLFVNPCAKIDSLYVYNLIAVLNFKEHAVSANS